MVQPASISSTMRSLIRPPEESFAIPCTASGRRPAAYPSSACTGLPGQNCGQTRMASHQCPREIPGALQRLDSSSEFYGNVSAILNGQSNNMDFLKHRLGHFAAQHGNKCQKWDFSLRETSETQLSSPFLTSC
jgi:hypothetical protein